VTERETSIAPGGCVGDVDYAEVFAQAPVPLLLLTPDLVIVDANQARLDATSTTLEDTVGQHLFDVFPMNPDDPAADGLDNLRSSLQLARDTRRPVMMQVQKYDIRMPDGSFEERFWSPRNVPVLDERGKVVLLMHRSDDITDYLQAQDTARLEVERAQQVEADLFSRTQELEDLNRQLRMARDELAVRALHDPLTGLLVRSVLLEQLSHALAALQRHPGDVAVLFVDLDGLKQVNDTHGHAAGDALIRCCAQRLQLAVRPSDAVARIGGDEFVVLLTELDPGEGVAAGECVAKRLLDALETPCTVAPGVLVRPQASVGIAATGRTSASRPGTDGAVVTADELLSRADTAMYTAKRAGRGHHRVFDEVVHRAVTDRERLELELRAAMPDERLQLHYQPIVDVSSGATYAVEALLRWDHPDGRLRSAEAFVEVAEQAGLLPEIGGWVIAEACRQLASWDAALGDRAPERMFLNLSAAELSQPGLHEHVADSTRRAGVDPRRLVLEVTETGVLDASGSAATVDALRHLGCQLAIDDFGTGYSSLSRLVQLPASVLKVDRSFLRDLHRDQQSVAVIAAVLTLAHNLRKTVVAEGVEDAASLAILQDLGCPYAQGYHLAIPQTADQLAAQLAGGSLPGGLAAAVGRDA